MAAAPNGVTHQLAARVQAAAVSAGRPLTLSAPGPAPATTVVVMAHRAVHSERAAHPTATTGAAAAASHSARGAVVVAVATAAMTMHTMKTGAPVRGPCQTAAGTTVSMGLLLVDLIRMSTFPVA